MSFCGKMAGGLLGLTLLGCGASQASAMRESFITSSREMPPEQPCYILKEYNGKPALFIEGKEKPYAVFSTPMELINPSDAKLLLKGIRLRDISEVNRLLEDLEIE